MICRRLGAATGYGVFQHGVAITKVTNACLQQVTLSAGQMGQFSTV